MATSIRMATPEDAAALLSIYAPLVRETAITFELEPPTVDTFRHRIRDTLARHPWLVCEHHGDLIGYAYAASHRARAAYRWSVETSTYVHAGYRRRGVARALYEKRLRVSKGEKAHGLQPCAPFNGVIDYINMMSHSDDGVRATQRALRLGKSLRVRSLRTKVRQRPVQRAD